MPILKWALIMLIVSVLAAFFGFTDLAAAGADVARQGMVSRVVSLVRHYLFGWIS